jgi:hypothetical protein
MVARIWVARIWGRLFILHQLKKRFGFGFEFEFGIWDLGTSSTEDKVTT